MFDFLGLKETRQVLVEAGEIQLKVFHQTMKLIRERNLLDAEVSALYKIAGEALDDMALSCEEDKVKIATAAMKKIANFRKYE